MTSDPEDWQAGERELVERVRAVRDRYTMAQPDKPDTPWAVLTEVLSALTAQSQRIAELEGKGDGASRDHAPAAGSALDWELGPFSSAHDVHDTRMLVLASYCGEDNPDCSDARPCHDCLGMSNVALVRGRINVLGRLDYLSSAKPADRASSRDENHD